MGSTVSRLGIGTAQFGSNYGISNTNGKVSKIEVAKILENASKSDDTLALAQGVAKNITFVGRGKGTNSLCMVEVLEQVYGAQS